MNICIVGGIFGKSAQYQMAVQTAFEVTLARGLKDRGHNVTTASHHDRLLWSAYDVVHVHHLGRGAIAAALDPGTVPYVFTPHNDPAGHAQRLALDFVQRRADAVVDLAETLARRRRAQLRKFGVRHVVIPPGIPTEPFPLRTQTLAASPWRILFVGQLISTKRVDLLLYALRALRDGGHDIRLDIIYHNNTGELPVRQLVERLNLAAYTQFRNLVSTDELADAYRAAHMVVLPSEAEFLPSVLTEAMMSGTPVVATSVGAVAEQVAQDGILVRPGSAPALMEGIAQMISDYPKFSRGSAVMSRRVRETFSVDAVITRHEELYEAVRQAKVVNRRKYRGTRSAPMATAYKVWLSTARFR